MGIIRFGTDGWRARLGEGFDEASVVRVAQALGVTWASRFRGATILVGYDTRRDSERLALLAGAVIASCGMQVVVSEGVCPTPALGWAIAQEASCVGGVMLTASEASHEYGGILVRQSDGGPVSSSFAEAVEMRIAGGPTRDRGSVERACLTDTYVAAVAQRLGHPFTRRTPRIVLDTMYGAMAPCAKAVFEHMGCDVISIHDQSYPDFRGLHPDAREPWVDECERAVLNAHADLGVALDGDGDHMAIIDAKGFVVSPHDAAPLALEYQVLQPDAGERVVATFGTSVRLRRQAERLRCDYTMVPLGFDAVYREFIEGDVLLAADERGGICVPAHLPERDGLYAAGCAVAALCRHRESSSDVLATLTQELGPAEWGSRTIRLDASSVQRLRNLLPGINPALIAGEKPVALRHTGGLRAAFADDSWLLVSPSPTRAHDVLLTAEASSTTRLGELLKAGGEIVRELSVA